MEKSVHYFIFSVGIISLGIISYILLLLLLFILPKISIKDFAGVNIEVKGKKTYSDGRELKTSKDIVHTEKVINGSVK